MYDKVIKLITSTRTRNEYGDLVERQVDREVFAELQSIGMSEFYQAQGVGLKPELKFKLADYLDYQGEQTISYTDDWGNTACYTVMKTYRKSGSNELELTCKKGVS